MPDTALAPLLPPALFRLPYAVLHAALATAIEGGTMAPAEAQITHAFADGVAARQLSLKAGSLATARRHLRRHVCLLTQGQMTIWQEGQEERVLDAPAMFVAEAGDCFMGYAHEDSVWVTIFPNPEGLIDPEALLDANEEMPSLALPEGYAGPRLLSEVFDAAP